MEEASRWDKWGDEASVARSGFRPSTGFRGGRRADRWQNIRTRTKTDFKRTGVQDGVAFSDSETCSHSTVSLPQRRSPQPPHPSPSTHPYRQAHVLSASRAEPSQVPREPSGSFLRFQQAFRPLSPWRNPSWGERPLASGAGPGSTAPRRGTPEAPPRPPLNMEQFSRAW